MLDSPSDYLWQSSNSSVANVNASGLVTAGQTTGTATITVAEQGSPQDQGKSASVTVTVGVSFVGEYIGDAGGLNDLTIDTDDGINVTAHDSRFYGGAYNYTGTRTGNHLILIGGGLQFEGDLVDGVYSGTYQGAPGFGIPPGPMNFNNRNGWKGNQFAWDYQLTMSTGEYFGVRINTDGTDRAGSLGFGTVSESFITNGGGCSDQGSFTMMGTWSQSGQGNFTGTLVTGPNEITGSGTYIRGKNKGTWTMVQLQ